MNWFKSLFTVSELSPFVKGVVRSLTQTPRDWRAYTGGYEHRETHLDIDLTHELSISGVELTLYEVQAIRDALRDRDREIARLDAQPQIEHFTKIGER